MASKTYAEAKDRMERRSKALAANSAELPELEISRARLDALLGDLRGLTAQQASLAAAKQEVSRQIEALIREGQSLLNLLDIGVKVHYGTRAEKLVEFGLQPFRSEPRVRLVGPDGETIKKKKKGKKGAAEAEPQSPTTDQ
ncbi:MAG TPA: hypothetical protein DD490_13195 [Acidobacteria bacterium]|nr:hypothetical protein [Acidobacteriota bacterium]